MKITVLQAATVVDVTIVTIYQMIRDKRIRGRLVPRNTPGDQSTVDVASLKAWIEAGRRASDKRADERLARLAAIRKQK